MLVVQLEGGGGGGTGEVEESVEIGSGGLGLPSWEEGEDKDGNEMEMGPPLNPPSHTTGGSFSSKFPSLCARPVKQEKAGKAMRGVRSPH